MNFRKRLLPENSIKNKFLSQTIRKVNRIFFGFLKKLADIRCESTQKTFTFSTF
ncbi:hypothetical protein BCAR13_520084 [Paraburkholderia caribensis]|nr:hypothetical protein BCAR13_520084 [Paraburkholderia caribensis]